MNSDFELSPSFWKGKRVFLTGHTGFKGAWLTLLLVRMGAEVVGYSLKDETSELYTSLELDGAIDSRYGDIRDFPHFSKTVLDSGADIFLHLAAQALVRRSYDQPIETYATNVMGTVHALESFRLSESLRSCVVVTTDKCYEDRQWAWGYRETDNLGGYDPYSNSKACAELVTSSYRKSFLAPSGKLVATARAGNVIGGGDWSKDRIVPDMINSFSAYKTLELRSPNAVRPWQHVLDPLRGYLMLAQKLYQGEAAFVDGWNFGPSVQDVCSVKDLVDRSAKIWGEPVDVRVHASDKHETHFLSLSSEKANRQLGWYPKLDLEGAIEWTVSWYQDVHRGRASARAMTERHIDSYLELI